MDNIQHIFFDLDHTLWDFRANSRETLQELFDEFDVGGEGGAEAFISAYEIRNERCWELYRQNRLPKGRLRVLRFEQALADIGRENNSLADRLSNAYLEICPRKKRLMEGAVETLQALHGICPLHILSNGFHQVQLTKLKTSGIDSYFNEIITSERARAKKPDPKIFVFAQETTGARPAETLMIGDNAEIDVAGARNAGWHALHFQPDMEGNSLDSINNLVNLVEILNRK